MKKRTRILAAALAAAMGLGTVALAANTKTIEVVPGINLTIDGQKVTPTNSAGEPIDVFAADGATYLPLRYLAEKLGMKIDWNQDTMTASVKTGAITYADTIAWDTQYDVVVIGFGGAGASASISAAEEGARVLLTEKAPEGHEGGNTRYCAQVCRYYEDYESGFAYVKAESEGFDHMTDEIIDYIVKGTRENPDWLTSLGLPTLAPGYVLGEYPELPGADKMWVYSVNNPEVTNGKTYWETIRKGVMDRTDSIDVWYESPATRLIQDPISKTVLGVEIERGGKTLKVRATNGVVMAMGGFENNEEMVENFTQRERMYPLGTTYNTGDGVKMALEVGADLWHMNALSGPWVTVKTEDMDRAYFNSMYQNIANNLACIYVGKDGTRFMPESGWQRHGHISYSGSFYSQLTPDPMYAIFDQSAVDAGLILPPQFSTDLKAEVESGIVAKADTIAELAEKIGIQVDTPIPNVTNPLQKHWDYTYQTVGLVNQVKMYNQYCADGFDPQFQRNPNSLVPIEKGPFYALELQPAMVNTQGGARRNLNCEIVDPNGNAIPHLYGAGEFGSFYGGLYTGGGNVAETMFTGRTAGTNAAKAKTEALPTLTFAAVESKLQSFGSDANKGAVAVETAANEYVGTGMGVGGDLTVKVTVENGKITKVDVVDHHETKGISDPAIEKIPAAIVEAGSVDVDSVSGATITSKAIKEAVKDALSQVK